ncbi:uncharacterized protein SCHCODRAFT_02687371 [Schizophyllum commune H4-8]|nr:uncharacterized protein SCHCODRAFT_02687371 [Schizophyllum commune H4-8]KAI5893274.1 hypothetical protein SCHCODRAFT_02687371 [Schizophyllum commune H4-8]
MSSSDWRGRGRYEALDDLPQLHRSDPPATPNLFTKAARPYTASPRNSIPNPTADGEDIGSAHDGADAYSSATHGHRDSKRPYPDSKPYSDSKDAADDDEADLRHVRRYSRQWMSLSWNNQVKRRGRWPRIVYTVAGVAVIALWVAAVLVFAQHETRTQEKNLTEDVARLKSIVIGDIGDALVLKGALRGFDVDHRVLTVQWSVVQLDEDDKTTFHDLGTDDDNTYELNIYRDVKAIPDDEATEFFEDQTTYYRVDNSSAYRIATVGMHPWDSFNTDIDMAQAVDNDVWKQPMFGYPWDVWHGSLTIVSTVAEFDRLYNTTGLGVFSLSAVSMEDSLLNWKIMPRSWTPCTEVNSTSCELYIDFEASRPGIVIFCVIIVVVVNCEVFIFLPHILSLTLSSRLAGICTLAIFLVTGEVILLKRRHILAGTDMLSVCFAALFALPTVRSLLPGAPGDFGAVIDFVGILPNVIIISLCTTVFACAKLRSRLKHTLNNSK